MSTVLPRESGPRKMRADAIAIFALGIMATVAVASLAVRMFTQTFTDQGVSWNLPVQPHPYTADGLTTYSADGPVVSTQITGTVSHLQVIVPNLNTVSAVCLGAAIVLGALAMLVIISSTVRIAWLFQRGQFFTLATSHAVRTFAWGLVAGGLGSYVCWNLGANGVEAALGVRATNLDTIVSWAWYFCALFTITSFGLIDIALRRAIRVQHDTEGLV